MVQVFETVGFVTGRAQWHVAISHSFLGVLLTTRSKWPLFTVYCQSDRSVSVQIKHMTHILLLLSVLSYWPTSPDITDHFVSVKCLSKD